MSAWQTIMSNSDLLLALFSGGAASVVMPTVQLNTEAQKQSQARKTQADIKRNASDKPPAANVRALLDRIEALELVIAQLLDERS